MKNCKFCDKKGLWIYVQLYGAVAADNGGDLAALPALSGTLGEGVNDIALSANARYAVRQVRPGFVYVLIERLGIRYWQAYMVIEGSFLRSFDAQMPPPQPEEFNCDRSSCGIGASVVSIDKVNTVDHVWLMFTPSPLTAAKLNEYRDNAPAYTSQGKMQHFDARAWANGNRTQPHTLKPEQLMTKAADFILYRQHEKAYGSALGIAMSKLLFPAESIAYAGTPTNQDGSENGFLGVMMQKLVRQKSAVMVLRDPIGITQELNDFRNAAFARIEGFLGQTDNFQVTNQRKLTVHEHIQRIRAGFHNGLVTSAEQSVEMADLKRRAMVEPIFPDDTAQMRRFKMQANNAYTHPSRTEWEAKNPDKLAQFDAAYENDLKILPERAKARARKDWQEKYLPKLDEAEMKRFVDSLDAVIAQAHATAATRVDDHLRWVTSARLINAFDTFDRANGADGHAFEGESALCTFGMTGVPKSAEQVNQWMKDFSVARANLYMRGHYLNQLELETAARQAMPQMHAQGESATEVSAISATAVVSILKKQIDVFKKIDSAYDEWVRNHKQQPIWGATREAAIFAKMSETTRFVFRTGSRGVIDKGMAVAMGALLYSRMGDLAEKIQLKEFLLDIKDLQKAQPELGQKKINKATTSAEVRARKVAAKVQRGMHDLIEDMRKKVREKANLSLTEIRNAHAEIDRQKAAGVKTPDVDLKTNNYHQARIGVALVALESIALAGKLQHFPQNAREWAELSGSLLSLASIGCDIVYASAKSIREIKPYSLISGIEKAGDVVRGGWKLTAGALGAGAGLVSFFLDTLNLTNELQGKQRGMLEIIFVVRAGVTARATWFGVKAAFSYAGPWLEVAAERAAKTAAANGGRSTALLSAARLRGLATTAKALKDARVLLLLRVARWNAIGLALTGAELAYHGYMHFIADNALQEWCSKSTFRKVKRTKNMLGVEKSPDWHVIEEQELKELDAAWAEVSPA